jgi:hypothetical protein
MVLGCSFRARARICFHGQQALCSEILACNVEQSRCNATTTSAWRYEKTHDRTDLLRIGYWLSVERMKQFARRRVAPTNDSAFVIREKALHSSPCDALACALAIFLGRSTRPMNLRMILIEALAVTRRPFVIVAERFTLEEGHEVCEARGRQRVNLVAYRVVHNGSLSKAVVPGGSWTQGCRLQS